MIAAGITYRHYLEFVKSLSNSHRIARHQWGNFVRFITPGFAWPNLLFVINQTTEADLKEQLQINDDCKTLLLPGLISADLNNVLSDSGYRLMAKWVNMYYPLNKSIPLEIPGHNLKVGLIQKGDGNIKSWVKLVSKVLFGGKLLDEIIFADALDNANMDYLCIWDEIDQLLSCLIMYTDSEGTSIYMVCTDPGFQKKGIGQFLIAHAMNYALELGSSKMYLSSTPQGLKLYQKLGFIELDPLMVYYKLI